MSFGREVVYTRAAPKPIGPYSQAIKVGNTLFVSGQIPVDPETGELVGEGIVEQAVRVMENLRSILKAAGFSLEDVVWVLVFLKDLRLFNDFNSVYARYFKRSFPARTTVEVSELPRGALLEVTLIACKGRGD